MKNGVTIFKWASPIICLIIIWLILNELNCGGKGKTEYKEVVKIEMDTVWLEAKTDTHYVAKPYKVVLHDTLEFESEPIVKYKDIPPVVLKAFEDWNSTKYFSDSFIVAHGKLYLFDTLRSGKLKKGFDLQQSIPLVKETITLREKPRTKGLVGLSIMGDVNTPLQQTGASFGLLFKSGTYLGIQGALQKGGNTLYGVQLMKVIKLRK